MHRRAQPDLGQWTRGSGLDLLPPLCTAYRAWPTTTVTTTTTTRAKGASEILAAPVNIISHPELALALVLAPALGAMTCCGQTSSPILFPSR